MIGRDIAGFARFRDQDDDCPFPCGGKVFQSEAAVKDLGHVEYCVFRCELED